MALCYFEAEIPHTWIRWGLVETRVKRRVVLVGARGTRVILLAVADDRGAAS